MDTPFFVPSYVARSPNFADSQLINLYPEVAEVPGGSKAVGVFYSTPGLTLLVACGAGPIRGMAVFLQNDFTAQVLYVVSGTEVYLVDNTFTATFQGNLPGTGPVNFVQVGGTNPQLMVLTTNGYGYMLPGGHSLNTATIATAGTQYQVGDQITLAHTNGQQVAAVTIQVASVSGTGGVTAFVVVTGGAFISLITLPTQFTQLTTTGSGAGIVLTNPNYSVLIQPYPVVLPFTPATSVLAIPGASIDGYGLIAQPGTYTLWQSNLLDLSTWNALAFGQASGDPDVIIAIGVLHLEVYVIKARHTEIWTDVGTSPLAFQRVPGTYIQAGCAAPHSLCVVGETLMWLASNSQGNGIIVQVQGYTATRVSTHAIEYAIQQFSSFADAVAYSYQQDGHTFYVIDFPTGNQTWVYDATESAKAGVPMWHQRAAFSDGVFNRHPCNMYAFFAQTHIVGDSTNGNLYAYDDAALTDNGAQRKWQKSWRALGKPTKDPVRFTALQIDMMTGANGTPPGTDPQVMLEWSDDGGNTWTQPIPQSAGQLGQTAKRVKFNRLGSTRRNSGLDRLFRLSSTDQFPVALMGADLT